MSNAKTFPENENELIEQGDYEVILKAEAKLYGENNDKTFLLCSFKIRDDVKQPFMGQVVFDRCWPDKDPNWDGWYDHRKLHKMLLTQVKPQLAFGDCDECVQYLNGLKMRITIDKKYDDYSQKWVNEVHYLSYSKSQVVETASNATPTVDLPVSGDDLPF